MQYLDIYKGIELQRQLSKLEETANDRDTFIKLLIDRMAMLQSVQAQGKNSEDLKSSLLDMRRRVTEARAEILSLNAQIIDIQNQIKGIGQPSVEGISKDSLENNSGRKK